MSEFKDRAFAVRVPKISGTDVPDDLRAELSSGNRQGGFDWRRAGWERWLTLPGVPGLLDCLGSRSDGRVDRSVVTRLVREHLPSNPELAFVAVMVWGYGNAGYGPFRTYRQLTQTNAPGSGVDDTVRASLVRSVEVLHDDGPEAAFFFMNNRRAGKIPHLGPAFFTKWLSFAAEADESLAGSVPIFDELVRSWLSGATGDTWRIDRTGHYRAYLGILDRWGAGEHSRVDVEEAIFGLARPHAMGAQESMGREPESDLVTTD